MNTQHNIDKPAGQKSKESTTRPVSQVDLHGVLKGIPSSAGVAIGRALVIEPETLISPNEKIEPARIVSEIERLRQAMAELIVEFNEVIEKVKPEGGNVAAILETNLLILCDPILEESIKERIKNGFAVESAVVQEFEEQQQYFKLSKDEILRERAIELDHIKKRLLSTLRHHSIFYAIAKNAVIVAQSLTPTELVNLKESGVLAIVTEVGGIASHVSILCRSFEIPAVIGVKDCTTLIESDANVIVDGYSGHVVFNPSEDQVERFNKIKEEADERRRKLGEIIKLKTQTSDKRKIHLFGNIDQIEEIKSALMVGAEGIGLVRSESLIYSEHHFPPEEEQYAWYKELAERAYPIPVTIRAFDIGSDKFAEGLPKREENPALGFRGIRFLLSRTDVFRTQIRAILRASVIKNIRFMLPMISTLKEVEDTLQLVEECKEELARENVAFDKKMPLGIMIETPGAALISDGLAEKVDFFSIGTNDLTQYTLAADRTNELIADIFNPFHPAVIRLMKFAVKSAHKHKIPVGICGEMAGHAAATSLLIGLGVDELSVAPPVLLELKSRILNIDYATAMDLANDILTCSTYEQVLERLEQEHS